MFLPFYCPTFRTEHLLEPCKKNLARVKALKAAKKHVGPLEKCLECKGKMLIIKPWVEIEGLPAPESWLEKRFVAEAPPNEAVPGHDHGKFVPFKVDFFKEPPKPYQQDWEPHPEVTTAPLFLKDVGGKEPEMRPLSPEKIAKGRAAGHNLGKKYKTRKVLDELPQLSSEKEAIYQRIMAKQEEISPELPKKQEETVPAVKITQKEAVKLGIVASELPPKGPIIIPEGERWELPLPPLQVEPRYCPTHPEVLQRVDRLGRWMGMCDECLSIRGKKCGEQNFERGVTAPPVSIPLNLPKYVELKAWLKDQAEEHEQTLQGAIMYILKMAWRQGA